MYASVDVVAGMPVASRISRTSSRSWSAPSHDPEVPFQAMTSTSAVASSWAAARMTAGSNCRSEESSRAIRVTGIRVKWMVTSSRSPRMR